MIVGHIIFLVFIANVFDVDGLALIPRGPTESNDTLEILKTLKIGIRIDFEIQKMMTSLIASKF